MAKLSKSEPFSVHSDAWSRFELAVDVVAKSPPQHRTKENKSPKKKVKRKEARDAK